MKLFNKRPLGLVLFILLSGFSIFALGSTIFKIVALCISFSLCFFSFFIKRFKGTLPKLACFTLLISFLASHVYFNYVFYPTEYFEKDTKIIAEIENVDVKSESFAILDLKTRKIDSENESYKIKLNLYGYHNSVKVGNAIEFETKLKEFGTDSNFDFKQFYTSRGFSATADATDFKIVGTETSNLLYRFSQIRKSITEKAVKLSNAEAGSMLGALLLGERDILPNQVRLDFTRIGITHILSLSGMHVAILMGGLDRLLYLLRIKRTSRLLCGCFAAFIFMGLTGFPLTVCRAGIMLIISSLLFIITGSKDSVTSLFVSATLIITASPYAALDIGLWLSVIATLGILVAGEIMNEKYSDDRGIKRFIGGLKTSLIFSLFAVSSSAVISALSFSGVSAISIFSTLIFSVLVEAFVYLGIAVLLIGEVIPIGKLLIYVSDILYELAANLSDLPLIYGSVEFTIVKIAFISLCVAFALFAILDIKKRKLFIGGIATLFCIATVLSIGITELYKNDDVFVCFNDSSERILIKSNGESLLYDASQHRKADGYTSRQILSDSKICELDYYMIANYTDYTTDSIEIILTNFKVKKILLPVPRGKSEDESALEIWEKLSNFRTEAVFYSDTEIFCFGEYEILTPFRTNKETCFATTFKRGEVIYTYFSSGILEYSPSAEELLYVSNSVIFGDYGTAYTKVKIIDEFSDKLKSAVIFDDKLYFDLKYAEGIYPKVYYPKQKHVIYD